MEFVQVEMIRENNVKGLRRRRSGQDKKMLDGSRHLHEITPLLDLHCGALFLHKFELHFDELREIR